MNDKLSIKIDVAFPSDALALRDLSEQTFFDTYATFNTPENMQQHIASHFDLKRIQQELEDEHVQYLLVKQGEKIIGFVKLIKNRPIDGIEKAKAFEIERFYILKTYQGQNLGVQLMNACFDWGKKAGFDAVWLGVWEHNPKAIQFYEKMGFRRFGKHTFTLGNEIQHDFLMKQFLH